MKFRHFAGICFLALALLAGQQAAFAHFIGHLAGTAATAVGQDPEHGHQESLAKSCVTCVAHLGLAGAAPPPAVSAQVADGFIPPLLLPVATPAAQVSASGYLSRAPPPA